MIIKANSVYQPVADKSVQAIITSPPYWGLRKYDVPDTVWDGDPSCEHTFIPITHIDKRGTGGSNLNGRNPYLEGEARQKYTEGFCSKCGAWHGQLGLEPDPELYISHLMQVMAECWRVLRDNGVCFVNLGDSYKRKSLCLIPEHFALDCLEAGWIIRNKIIWYKLSTLPESVKDRFSKRHERIFMFTKQQKYYFNLDATREPYKDSSIARISQNNFNPKFNGKKKRDAPSGEQTLNPKQFIKWDCVPGQQKQGTITGHNGYYDKEGKFIGNSLGKNPGDVWAIANQPYPGAHFATFPPKLVERMLLCSTKIGDVVLDPFGGSGTVGRVAIRYRRRPVLLDLGYQDQQIERMREVQTVLC